MQRYFVHGNLENIIFNEQDLFHIEKVMRNKVGDEIEIVLDSKAYLVAIDSFKPFKVHIVNPILKETETPYPITLFFPLTKSDKAELVIQKATEIGVHRIIFYRAIRSVVKLDEEGFNKKKVRYESIAKEAAEQCHRLLIPNIVGVINFNDIKSYLSKHNLLAFEMDAGRTSSLHEELDNVSGDVSIIVGPEGGFDNKEISYLDDIGFHHVSLGKRILRCETAAIYALSVISSYMER